MKYGFITLVVLTTILHNSYENCEFLNDILRPFHKIQTCYRSNLPVIARSNTRSDKECIRFAKDRNGLAVNYSPQGAKISKFYQDNFFANCLVLGCPEIVNSSTFVNDTAFDYYSIYGDTEEALANTSCIKSVGVFRVFQEKANYTAAVRKCQEIGGELAHIISETRTIGLSNLVNNELTDWYKMAFVGLDDRQREGFFITSMGAPLNCYRYRAWGPGQPRNKYKYEDCVVIDSENTWKVMNCLEKFSFVCEIYPTAPPKMETFKSLNCSEIEDEEKRNQCRLESKSHLTTKNITTSSRC